MRMDVVIYISNKQWIAFKISDRQSVEIVEAWCIEDSSKQKDKLREYVKLEKERSNQIQIIVGAQTEEDEVKSIEDIFLASKSAGQQNIKINYIHNLLGEILRDEDIDILEPSLYIEVINDTLKISLIKKRVARSKRTASVQTMNRVSSLINNTLEIKSENIELQLQNTLKRLYEEAYLKGIGEEEIKSLVVMGVRESQYMNQILKALPVGMKHYTTNMYELVKCQMQVSVSHAPLKQLNKGICIKSYNRQTGQLEYPQVFEANELRKEVVQKTFWLMGSYYNQRTIELEFYTSEDYTKIGSIKFPFEPSKEQGMGRFKVEVVSRDKKELEITVYDMYLNKKAIQTQMALA